MSTDDDEWTYSVWPFEDDIIYPPRKYGRSMYIEFPRKRGPAMDGWFVVEPGPQKTGRASVEPRYIAGPFPTLGAAKAACLLLIAARSET